MRISILFFFTALAILFGLLYAQPSVHFPNPLPGNAIVSNTISVSSKFTTENASSASIAAGKLYISSRLGENYSTRYVAYTSGFYFSATNQTSLYFSYKLPFDNGTIASAFSSSNLTMSHISGITVVLNGENNVIGYYGPQRSYVINVTSGSAISIASLYGVYDGTATLSYAENTSSSNALSGYSIVWAVTGKNTLANYTAYPDVVYPGIYISITNGSIMGEYLYNTSSITTQPGNSIDALGAFGFFSINSSKPSVITPLNFSAENATGVFTLENAVSLITLAAAVMVLSAVFAILIYILMSHKGR